MHQGKTIYNNFNIKVIVLTKEQFEMNLREAMRERYLARQLTATMTALFIPQEGQHLKNVLVMIADDERAKEME